MKTINYLSLLALNICLIFILSCNKKLTNQSSSETVTKTFTDPRDGEVYPLTTIDNQVWFAENLRYNAEGSILNPYNPSKEYGRLYEWGAAMNACPAGWHLPTDNEWKKLEMSLGLSFEEVDGYWEYRGSHGKEMKSVNAWGWGDASNRTNSSGFNAFPAGLYYSGNFVNLGTNAYFWSATEYDATDAWNRCLSYSNIGVNRTPSLKTFGYSCRCLQD